jgi:hypothetical protein
MLTTSLAGAAGAACAAEIKPTQHASKTLRIDNFQIELRIMLPHHAHLTLRLQAYLPALPSRPPSRFSSGRLARNPAEPEG